MNFYTGWDEETFKRIAKKTGVRQFGRDVYFMRCVVHNNTPKNVYAERIEELACIMAYFGKEGRVCRVIGVGTAVEAQGKGLAGMLIERLFTFCQLNGVETIKTKTKTGARFYEKYGFIETSSLPNGEKMMEAVL